MIRTNKTFPAKCLFKKHSIQQNCVIQLSGWIIVVTKYLLLDATLGLCLAHSALSSNAILINGFREMQHQTHPLKFDYRLYHNQFIFCHNLPNVTDFNPDCSRAIACTGNRLLLGGLVYCAVHNHKLPVAYRYL